MGVSLVDAPCLRRLLVRTSYLARILTSGSMACSLLLLSVAALSAQVPGIEPAPPTVRVFAHLDGQLGQVMINDELIGAGETAFVRLSEHLEKETAAGQTLAYRVAYMSSVRDTDLQTIKSIVVHRRYNPREKLPEFREDQVQSLSLYEARMKQPSKEGLFIAKERFADRGPYIQDRWTGLLWQKDGIASGKKNFLEAGDYAQDLTLGKLQDWRVPTKEELATIFPADYAPFRNSMYTPLACCKGAEFVSFWTSEIDARSADTAYVYQWYNRGGANNCLASRNYCYVRCVHNPVEEDQLDE